MKKTIIALFLTIVMVVSLTGCELQLPGSSSSKSNGRPYYLTDAEGMEDLPVVTVDFSKDNGSIKDVNGINNGPKSGYSETKSGKADWKQDMTSKYETLGIPSVRTHDMEYPNGSDQFIDIHCIFPDFSKDADDPDSYDFEKTDLYITNIIDSGANVFYRLGESIAEVGEEDTNEYIKPPTDYEKWTKICSNIIAHYNEGWDNGYKYDIKYWEIWNEPDNSRQWNGTMEQYCELYRTAARTLKETYPDIMIGGGAIATPSEETVTEFLDGITSDGASTPLDFFSWHVYTDNAYSISQYGTNIRQLLDEKGYKDTLSVLGEWNYVYSWQEDDLATTWKEISSLDMASFYTKCLINMQLYSVDMAYYYDGTMTGDYPQWCGLYNSSGKEYAGFYAFQFFKYLKDAGKQAQGSVEGDTGELAVLAATGKHKRMLITNTGEEDQAFTLSLTEGVSTAKITQIDEENPNGKTVTVKQWKDQQNFSVEPGQVLYIDFE